MINLINNCIRFNCITSWDLTFEIKDDFEKFEDYNPDWLFLRVLKYVDDTNYDFTKMEKLPT